MIAFAVSLLLFYTASATSAFATDMTITHNKKALKYVEESDLVLIGDSRVHDIYRYLGGKKEKKASFNAIRGGLYNYADWPLEYSVDTEKNITKITDRAITRKNRTKKVKQIIKKTLEKHGTCTVIVVGTINECNFTEDNSIKKYIKNNLIRYVKELTKVKANYKNKKRKKTIKVKPTVYVATSPGAHPQYDYKPWKAAKYKEISSYNKLIEELCEGEDFDVIEIKQPKGYQFKADQLHFPYKGEETSYNQYLWKEFSKRSQFAKKLK